MEAVEIKGNALTRFCRNACENFNLQTNECVYDKLCDVLLGKSCTYFERSVLGRLDYPYRISGYDYEKVFDLYARINHKYLNQIIGVRVCRCGEAILPRKRYCEKCRKKQARDTARERKRKNRQSARLNVTS